MPHKNGITTSATHANLQSPAVSPVEPALAEKDEISETTDYAAVAKSAEHHPPLTREKVLALQRTIGNQAVNRILARQRQSSKNAVKSEPGNAPLPNTIQRKFGLEVELQVALTRKFPTPVQITTGPAFKPQTVTQVKDVYRDPRVVWAGLTHTYPTVADAGTYEIKVDHNKKVNPQLDYSKPIGPGNDMDNDGGAIAELVTKPMDENLAENQVEARVQELVDFANALNYGPGGLTKLNTIGANDAHDSIYIGTNHPNAASYQKKMGEMQTTYGVKLGRINKLFSWKAKKATSGGQSEARADVWEAGAKMAREYMAALPAPFPPLPATAATPAEKDELLGLITLICNYLVARKVNTGVGWGKNKLGGMFYKSKLSEVRNSLASAGIKTWLSANAVAIANNLTGRATVTGQTIATEIDNNTGAVLRTWTCEQWLQEVLTGTEDGVFMSNKNPYAGPLGPEGVGPTGQEQTGAIMENRATSRITGVGGGSVTSGSIVKAGYPVDQWVTVAKRIHKMVKAVNANAEPSDTDLNATMQ